MSDLSRSSSPRSWTPEPLVPELEDDDDELGPAQVLSSRPGKLICVNGREALNAATHDYLNLADSERLERASIESVRRYGVGSCGPRAFYGTMDVHLELESRLADFLAVQEVALYSFAFATIASAIPAYAKATDVILYDEQCNFAIQKGLTASRGRAIKFAHNDPRDLELKLRQVRADHERQHGKSKPVRTFLIVEALYLKTGDLCPLGELVQVARRHKTRVFLDESRSFGVLGATGRGATEHWQVPVDEIDLIMVSLENALCSYGGFCAGTSFIIDHQRLAGSGYCFSASLPPFQCSAALEALQIIREQPERVARLREVCQHAQEKLDGLTQLRNISHALSPLKVLVFRGRDDSESEGDDNEHSLARYKAQLRRLDGICRSICDHEQIAVTVARYLDDEEVTCPPASIRLALNAGMTHDDVDRICAALEKHSTMAS